MRVVISRVRVVAVVIAATAGLCTGCGSTSSQNEAITEWSGQQLNDYQLKIAADGVVTDAELRDAYDQASRCVEKDGWQAEIRDSLSGGLSISVSPGKGGDIDAASAKLDSCMAEWVGPLDAIYQSTRVPQGAEREAKFAEFQDCMTSNGGSVDGAVLGQEQSTMMQALIAANGPYADWDLPLADCVEKYYFVLWPETLGG